MSNNHQFPEMDVYDPLMGGGGGVQLVEIRKWFKQCIEDFPEYHSIGYGIGREEEYSEWVLPIEAVEEWFEKWLGQFKEES